MAIPSSTIRSISSPANRKTWSSKPATATTSANSTPALVFGLGVAFRLPRTRSSLHEWLLSRGAGGVKRSQNLFRPGAHAQVFREIHPGHFAARVYQKFGRARNVRSISAPVQMHQVPAANHIIFGVRKNRESISGRLPEVLGLLLRVHANSDHTNLAGVKLWQSRF